MIETTALDTHLELLCHQYDPLGVAVAIVKKAKIIYARAFGQYDKRPLTIDTPLPVASLTKPVFAYTVLKLTERGILSLDTPLAHYLPDAYIPNEPLLPLMMARHALNHTTGFPNWREASGLRATFAPGTKFNYSTEGYLYLQTVIEHLIQQPLSVYMMENVFKPFEMLNSQLVPEDLSVWRSYLPDGLRGYGGISLYTTAPDYARFFIEMLQPTGPDAFRLSSTTLAQMLTPYVRVGDQDQLSWGLGWSIQHAEPEDSFWHFGVKGGSTFNFALGYPNEQTGVVILTCQAIGLSICEEIAHIIFDYARRLPAFGWLLPPEHWRADGRKLIDPNSEVN